MKLKIARETLINMLRTVAPAARNSSLPALNNTVYLEACEPGALRVRATDLEIDIAVAYVVQMEDPGEVVVPLKLLLDTTAGATGEWVGLEIVGKSDLQFVCGGTKAKIKGYPGEDYPMSGAAGATNYDIIPGDVLAGAIGSVAYAASSDTSRPALNGIEMSVNGNLAMAATDGYRLSIRKMAFDARSEYTIIVPVRCMQTIAGLVAKCDTVHIGTVNGIDGPTALIVETQDMMIRTSLIAGKYPDYRAIIPKTQNFTAHADTEELRNAIKTALLFAKDNGAHAIRLTSTEDGLTVTGTGVEVGDTAITVAAKCTGSLSMSCNAKYLLDVLSTITAQQVHIEAIDDKHPLTMRPAATNADAWNTVIMPVFNGR